MSQHPLRAKQIRQCLTCGKDFRPWASQVSRGLGHYCSVLCSNRRKQVGEVCTCVAVHIPTRHKKMLEISAKQLDTSISALIRNYIALELDGE